MYKVFISSRQNEMANFRNLGQIACTQNLCIPVLIELEYSGAKEIVTHMTDTIKECDLFVGIYGNEYGDRIIEEPSGNKISPIEFEFKYAMKHFKKENIQLYVQNSDSREPDLSALYNEHLRKYRNFPFDNSKDFRLQINANIKKWQSEQTREQEKSTAKDNLISVEVKCKDAQGILTCIFRVLAAKGGNVSRAKQLVYRNMADITVLAKLDQPCIKQPSEDKIKSAIKEELISNYDKDITDTVDIDVRNIEKEASQVNNRGHFTVEFFDNPGIAELIFAVFSEEKICILESSLEHFPSSPQVGRFYIIANLTDQDSKTTNSLVPQIEEITNVIHVDGRIEIGTWWY